MTPGTDDYCCGNCIYMPYEDTDGYGWCDLRDMRTHCGLTCAQHITDEDEEQ